MDWIHQKSERKEMRKNFEAEKVEEKAKSWLFDLRNLLSLQQFSLSFLPSILPSILSLSHPSFHPPPQQLSLSSGQVLVFLNKRIFNILHQSATFYLPPLNMKLSIYFPLFADKDFYLMTTVVMILLIHLFSSYNILEVSLKLDFLLVDDYQKNFSLWKNGNRVNQWICFVIWYKHIH